MKNKNRVLTTHGGGTTKRTWRGNLDLWSCNHRRAKQVRTGGLGSISRALLCELRTLRKAPLLCQVQWESKGFQSSWASRIRCWISRIWRAEHEKNKYKEVVTKTKWIEITPLTEYSRQLEFEAPLSAESVFFILSNIRYNSPVATPFLS